MKINEGNTDRIVRIVLAAILAVLYFSGVLTGTLGIVLLVAAGVLLITGLTGFCGLYTLLGVDTCSISKNQD